MSFFSLVSILISLAAVLSYINYRYIKLPTTIGVMPAALVASLTLVLVGPYAGGFREQAATLVSQIDFNQVVLHGMLAFLLFAGAIQVNLDELGREWLTISLLAILGTLISTCIVGGVTWLVLGRLGLGIPFLHALLFGALISPTDPIAVLGIMKSVGASRQLEVQVAGVLAIPILLSARLLSVAGIIGPLSMVTAQSKGAIPVLTWGGLRGGISLAMALSLPANDSRNLVLTLTYFVVVFSILVQGLTVSRVIRTTSGSTAAPQCS